MQLTELIQRWDSGDGKPYKGELIDMSAYEEGNLSCMCAQGQVLHIIAGVSVEDLAAMDQAQADTQSARTLNISRAHAVLLRNVNDSVDGAPSIVLTDPGKVLGNQWSKLLDFWWALDQFTAEDWAAARAPTGDATWDAARPPAEDAARDATWAAARVATWAAVGSAVGSAAWASNEIQGAAVMVDRGQAFFFLPMFGFANPDAIPARPANYGIPA